MNFKSHFSTMFHFAKPICMVLTCMLMCLSINATILAQPTGNPNQRTPPPIPEHIIEQMRQRGVPEATIQRMIERRNQMMNNRPTGTTNTTPPQRPGSSDRPTQPTRSYSIYSLDYQLEQLGKYAQSAPKVQRVHGPKHSDGRPRLLVAPFGLPNWWMDHESTSVNLAGILVSQFAQTPGLDVIEHAKLSQAWNQMTLDRYCDTNDAIGLGLSLDADMVLYGTVKQSDMQDEKENRSNKQKKEKTDTTIMLLQVLDSHHASILAEKQIDLQASAYAPLKLNDEDLLLIRTTADQLVKQACDLSSKMDGKIKIAPLFLGNLSGNDRLDYLAGKLHELVSAKIDPSKAHVLQYISQHHDQFDTLPGIASLASANPDAWQFVADCYIWGTIAESKTQQDTAAQDIPVTLTVFCWDGSGKPDAMTEKIPVSQLPEKLASFTNDLVSRLPDRPQDLICKDINTKMAELLKLTILKNQSQVRYGSPVPPQPPYAKYNLELAAFFDPKNASVACERTMERFNEPGIRNIDAAVSARHAIEGFEDFANHFPNSIDKVHVTAMQKYANALNSLLEVYFITPNPRFNRDSAMPMLHMDAIKHVSSYMDIQQQINDLIKASGFLANVLEQYPTNAIDHNRHIFCNEIESLIKQLDKVSIDTTPDKQSILDSLTLTWQRLSEPLKKNNSKDQPVQEPSNHIDPAIIAEYQKLREGKEDPAALRRQEMARPYRMASPHPIWNVQMPRLDQIVIPGRAYVMNLADSTHAFSPKMSVAIHKLVAHAPQVWLLDNRGQMFPYDMANPDQRFTRSFDDTGTIMDILVEGNTLYRAERGRGIAIINLNDQSIQRFETQQGLHSSSPLCLAKIGDTLYVTFSGNTLNAIDLMNSTISQMQIPDTQHRQSEFDPGSMQVCGSFLLLDDEMLFDPSSGQSHPLPKIEHRKAVIANQQAIWILTDTQLIAYDPATKQQKQWDLPCESADMLAITDDTVYLAYNQPVDNQRDPYMYRMGMPNLSEREVCNLVAWDIAKEKIRGRMALPGRISAMAVSDNDLVLLLKRELQHQFAYLLGPKPRHFEQDADQQTFTVDTANKDYTQVATQLADQAFIGNLSQVKTWLKAENRNRGFGKKILAAACFKAPTSDILALVDQIIKDVPNPVTCLDDALYNALFLDRNDVFDGLLAKTDLSPASDFSPEMTPDRYQNKHTDFEFDMWKMQREFVRRILIDATAYRREHILSVFDRYAPQNGVVSYGYWYLRPAQNEGFVSSLVMSIMLDDQELFDKLLVDRNSPNAIDSSTLPAALSSHNPHYLQTLLSQELVTSFSLKHKSRLTINPSVLEKLYDWATAANQPKRCRMVLPLCVDLNDMKGAEKLFMHLYNVNDPDLVMFIVKSDKLELMDMLLKRGWDVTNKTPASIMASITHMNLRTLDWLIKHGYPVNQSDDHGMTALMHASKQGMATHCYLLLESGANVMPKDDNGMAAYDMSRSPRIRNVLRAYMDNSNKPASPSLTATKPRPNNLNDEELRMLLTDAARDNDMQLMHQYIAWLLVSNQRHPTPSLQVHPLHYTACRGDIETSRLLIEYEPQWLTHQDADGWTPLVYAAANGQDRMVDFLLEKHTPWQVENKQHMTAIEMARRNGHENVLAVFKKFGLLQKDGRHLIELLYRKQFDEFKRLINEEHYDINGEDENGMTVLHFAMDVSRSNILIFRYPTDHYVDLGLARDLLAMGANVNHQDHQGNTILHRMLDALYVGYNPDATAWEEALKRQVNWIAGNMEFIMKNGFKTDIVNNRKQTVLDLAQQNIRYDVLKKRVLTVLTNGKEPQ